VRLVVAGLKGGVGKTTSAVYLSAVARRHGLVTLVDADPQASAAEWLEERPLEGVVVVEAPSERLLVRALDRAEGASVVVDTPPGSERLVRAAVDAEK
jgi:chromosome partitioning protein